MSEIKSVLARNLTDCRKAANLTQLQLAEKLNYSDKAVSKWERGESIPDVIVLSELAKLYGVTLDYLVTDHGGKPIKTKKQVWHTHRKHFLITIISCGLVWLLATIAYSVLEMCGVSSFRPWMLFIYALPISSIILIVFSSVWANKYFTSLAVSLLIWTLALATYLTLPMLNNRWLIFVIAVPLQLLTIFWFILRGQKKFLRHSVDEGSDK